MNEDVLAANLANWESRVPVHVTGYGLERFLEDLSHLSDVVSYDAPALGDLTGRRVAHLQCHIGTDTISLARLGADVVGLDFSPSAVEVARDLADRAGNVARFVQADVYDAPRSDPLVPVLDLTVEATSTWPGRCHPRYSGPRGRRSGCRRSSRWPRSWSCPPGTVRPGGLPCPWNRGTVDTVACRKSTRGKR